jgi:cytochrome c oxidase subunit 2
MWSNLPLFPARASTMAGHVDALYFALVAMAAFFTCLVAGLILFFAVRYRKSRSPQATQIHGSTALELLWTGIPLGIVMIIFVWSSVIFFMQTRPPRGAMEIYCVGKQWMWKFQHPEGQREINSLHVPVGRPIRLLMTSEDVIHSLFIPDFRLHMDLLPERYTSVWFEATHVGKYHLFCSQYCGTNHAGMTGEITVMEPAEYEKWLHSGAEGSMALEGRKVFLKNQCASCHSADSEARAPVLEDLFDKPVILSDGQVVRADENYIRESIVLPSAKIVAGYDNIMPTFKGLVSEEEIFQLIAYIKSLKAGQTPKRVEDFPPPATTPPNNKD